MALVQNLQNTPLKISCHLENILGVDEGEVGDVEKGLGLLVGLLHLLAGDVHPLGGVGPLLVLHLAQHDPLHENAEVIALGSKGNEKPFETSP